MLTVHILVTDIRMYVVTVFVCDLHQCLYQTVLAHMSATHCPMLVRDTTWYGHLDIRRRLG